MRPAWSTSRGGACGASHCGSILGVAATTAGWPLALMNDTLGRGRDAPTP